MEIVNFKHKSFIGKECLIDVDFEHSLKLMGDIALLSGLKIYITSSYRADANVDGAIVPPSKMSNHMVGHAIDCNIVDGDKFWNSKMLEYPSHKINDFIDKCKLVGLRWGGDFLNRDTVHFDDGLNIRNPKLWHEKYKLINK